MNEQEHMNLQNEKFLVGGVSCHDGLFSFIIGDVVFLDVHFHLMLLQMQQQLKFLRVILPAQGISQQLSSEQTKENKTNFMPDSSV